MEESGRKWGKVVEGKGGWKSREIEENEECGTSEQREERVESAENEESEENDE